MLDLVKLALDYLRLPYGKKIRVCDELGLLTDDLCLLDCEEMDKQVFKLAYDNNQLQEMALSIGHWGNTYEN